MDTSLIVALVITFVIVIILFKTAVVVPQQNAYVVERLGKFSSQTGCRFSYSVPFIDRVAYKTYAEGTGCRHSRADLHHERQRAGRCRRRAVHAGSRPCACILWYRQLHVCYIPACTDNIAFGNWQDRSGSNFRGARNDQSNVVQELDKASDPWGVKVLRYEIKNINPPHDVLSAMEKQMRAEREKRAVILTSEGVRDAKVNEAEGEKQRVIKESEAAKMQQINEAEGEAEAILAVATATAEGLTQGRECRDRSRRRRSHAVAYCRAVHR